MSQVGLMSGIGLIGKPPDLESGHHEGSNPLSQTKFI